MNPKDPEVLQRQIEIRNLLNDGVPIRKVAEKVGLSRKRVYDYATREGLPYNAPIREGGNKERAILELMAIGVNKDLIGQLHRMSPAAIDAVVDSVKKRIFPKLPQ